MGAKLEFTGNEAVSMMHQDKASAFRSIANFIEKNQYSLEETVIFLRETADECEAQAMVVDLRDKL